MYPEHDNYIATLLSMTVCIPPGNKIHNVYLSKEGLHGRGNQVRKGSDSRKLRKTIRQHDNTRKKPLKYRHDDKKHE